MSSEAPFRGRGPGGKILRRIRSIDLLAMGEGPKPDPAVPVDGNKVSRQLWKITVLNTRVPYVVRGRGRGRRA